MLNFTNDISMQEYRQQCSSSNLNSSNNNSQDGATLRYKQKI